jgi:hypothetical protein
MYYSSLILLLRSTRMRSPRSGLDTGSAIHCSIAGGIQAGSVGRNQFAGSLLLNPCSRPLDSSSASTAPVSEHRVIFSMLTVAPRAAAIRLIAATSVVQSEHDELYPFRQMATDPALSTQIRTGLLRQMADPLARQMSGPTSSKADNFFRSCRPSSDLILLLIFLPQGTMNQKFGPTPPVPCPIDIMEPPAASV